MKGIAGATLHLWITGSSSTVSSGSTSKCRCGYVNLELYPGSRLGEGSFKACLLLENPQSRNKLSYDQLQQQVYNTQTQPQLFY